MELAPKDLTLDKAKHEAFSLMTATQLDLATACQRVARKYIKADWTALMRQLNTQHELQYELPLGVVDVKDTTHTIVVVNNDKKQRQQKLLELAEQVLEQGYPVYFIANPESFRPSQGTRELDALSLKAIYGSSFHMRDYSTHMVYTPFHSAVVIIEELFEYLQNHAANTLQITADRAASTIVGSKAYADFSQIKHESGSLYVIGN